MSVQTRFRYTMPDYLALERSTELRHEYLDGEVFAMGGASYAHTVVAANVARELGNQLKDKPCRVSSADLRVKVSRSGLYTYPDIVVGCGPPQLEQPRDTLLNPQVISEILSDSTEAYDRGKKFEHYRSIETLSDYLLVSQDRYQLERFSREADGRWIYRAEAGSNRSMSIESIGCVLALREVFAKVDGVHEPSAAPYR